MNMFALSMVFLKQFCQTSASRCQIALLKIELIAVHSVTIKDKPLKSQLLGTPIPMVLVRTVVIVETIIHVENVCLTIEMVPFCANGCSRNSLGAQLLDIPPLMVSSLTTTGAAA
jgi:hypothetical protein